MNIFSLWGNLKPDVSFQDQIFQRLEMVYFEYFYPHLCALVRCENADSIFRF